MTALERIKEVEVLAEGNPGGTWKDPIEAKIFLDGPSDRVFLLRAFRAMREIAIDAVDQELTGPDSKSGLAGKSIDEAFEQRMKDAEEHSQWFKDGDHPMIRMFNPPPAIAVQYCQSCHKEMGAHGWLETAAEIVCPGDQIGRKVTFFVIKPT